MCDDDVFAGFAGGPSELSEALCKTAVLWGIVAKVAFFDHVFGVLVSKVIEAVVSAKENEFAVLAYGVEVFPKLVGCAGVVERRVCGFGGGLVGRGGGMPEGTKLLLPVCAPECFGVVGRGVDIDRPLGRDPSASVIARKKLDLKTPCARGIPRDRDDLAGVLGGECLGSCVGIADHDALKMERGEEFGAQSQWVSKGDPSGAWSNLQRTSNKEDHADTLLFVSDREADAIEALFCEVL